MEKEASKLIKILNTVVQVYLQVIHSLESQRRLRRRRKGAKRSKLAKDIETNCNSNRKIIKNSFPVSPDGAVTKVTSDVTNGVFDITDDDILDINIE